jgi:hypothetical protein
MEIYVTDNLKQSVTKNDAAPSLPGDLATLRWAFINWWAVESQSDDRTPMAGSAASSMVSPSVKRSVARRRHQRMYKEWSQDRHD